MARILVVDDSRTQQESLSKMLTRHGHDVLIATDGETAVASASKEVPDLILMDVVMPGMNGFQATRFLTKSPDTMNIPVLMVSTKSDQTDQVWASRQGAKAYITKPVDGKSLLESVKNHLV